MQRINGDWPSSSFLTVIMSIVFIGLFCQTNCARSPALFIFGDSLIDNGNNNYIPSIARANYFPYGIDFGKPTGRFCNGLTVADYAGKYACNNALSIVKLIGRGSLKHEFALFAEAQHLGLPFPSPYLSLASKSSKILRGVNYASAAAGILDETGRHYGSRISFNGQIELFSKTVKVQLPLLIPDSEKLSQYLSSSLFVINIGSNDFINNYLLPNLYLTSSTYSAEDFVKLLIDNLTRQLTIMYNLGARKMLLVGIGPLGCIPSQLAMSNSNSSSRCIDQVNELVKPFNLHLIPAMIRLNSTLPGSFFVYQNIFDTFSDMIQNPSKYGFSVSNQACCGNGRYGGQLSCLPLQKICTDRDHYIFWDSFHPTQAANAVMARRCFGAAAGDCFPISADQLAEL